MTYLFPSLLLQQTRHLPYFYVVTEYKISSIFLLSPGKTLGTIFCLAHVFSSFYGLSEAWLF